MGHRQFPNTSQSFKTDSDHSQSHNAAGLSYDHMGRRFTPEIGPFFNSVQTVPTSGINFSSQHRLEGGVQSERNFRLEGCFNNTFPFVPPGGSFNPAPEFDRIHAQSSHYNRHIIHGEGHLVDRTDIGREALKRKRPSTSVSGEGSSTNRFHDAGSSSGSFKLQPEKPTADNRNHFPMNFPHHSCDTMSIGGEDFPRNVRSRHRLDLEPNRRTYPANYSSHHHWSNSHMQNYPAYIPDINAEVSAPTHGRFQTSANNFLSQNMSQSVLGGPTDISRDHHHQSNFRRNLVSPPQYTPHAHAAWENQSDYYRRDIYSHRNNMLSTPLGQQMAASENNMQFISETYPPRHSNLLSTGGWQNNYSERRSGIATEALHSFSNVSSADDRVENETLLMLNHPFYHASRSFFDQYGDLRLDVDNMSYEELLDLGERIGNVNTGLSKDAISKCLIEITHSSCESYDETSCAICLEEYKNIDKIGTVKNCRHGYHAECIKKWLEIKNACPICKAPALADSSNGK